MCIGARVERLRANCGVRFARWALLGERFSSGPGVALIELPGQFLTSTHAACPQYFISAWAGFVCVVAYAFEASYELVSMVGCSADGFYCLVADFALTTLALKIRSSLTFVMLSGGVLRFYASFCVSFP